MCLHNSLSLSLSLSIPPNETHSENLHLACGLSNAFEALKPNPDVVLLHTMARGEAIGFFKYGLASPVSSSSSPLHFALSPHSSLMYAHVYPCPAPPHYSTRSQPRSDETLWILVEVECLADVQPRSVEHTRFKHGMQIPCMNQRIGCRPST